MDMIRIILLYTSSRNTKLLRQYNQSIYNNTRLGNEINIIYVALNTKFVPFNYRNALGYTFYYDGHGHIRRNGRKICVVCRNY